ncbi:protein PHLOEM PROTEIN 2-LIKE A1-like [Coffea eugenioides]|uniref:protein PHLOEM PROTEIN 2-LIKE A1-like n=1 Tax=Coffea eugenioides TaxID=49369 RepID=UPI000F614337|nr:protein PHLOEM PROTEIN 2-LIKE A1-like [Coffea eugenioides]
MAVGGKIRENKKEEFLEHKKKKRWVDEKSGNYCFMLYPRSLYVTWGQREYWDWKCFKETSDDNIEVVKLSHICWLDVRGKFKMSDLSKGAMYEVVYMVKLTKGADGWELPITLRLSLPGGEVQERKVSLLEKPRGEWIELNLGSFQASDGEHGEVCFDLWEHGGHWKNGLLVQGAIIRPCN